VAGAGKPELTVGQGADDYALMRVGEAGAGFFLHEYQFVEELTDDGSAERVDVGEVEVDGGRGDAGGAGDASQGERRGGWILKELSGCVDDVISEAVALAAGVALAAQVLGVWCGHGVSPRAGS
jgi:hypothetical protein